MTGGLKPIRDKQESGSQKGFRFPAFLDQSRRGVRGTDKIFGEISKSGESGLYLSRFYAILHIIVKLHVGLSAFQNIKVKKKRKARTRL